MWSLVPRPIRRYRREHPYSHPLIFLCVDILDSSVKLVLTCGAIYGIYLAATSTSSDSQPALARSSTPVETLTIDSQITPVSALKTTLITASSTAAPGRIIK